MLRGGRGEVLRRWGGCGAAGRAVRRAGGRGQAGRVVRRAAAGTGRQGVERGAHLCFSSSRGSQHVGSVLSALIWSEMTICSTTWWATPGRVC